MDLYFYRTEMAADLRRLLGCRKMSVYGRNVQQQCAGLFSVALALGCCGTAACEPIGPLSQ